MNYGRLIHKMALESRSQEAPARGIVPAATWMPEGSVFAGIEQLTGRKLEYARQIVPDATHEITVRYDQRIEADMRLAMDGRNFYIAAPPNNEMERNRKMILICVERQDAEQANG